MKNSNDVAKCLLTLSRPETGDVVSNLKLQKLLYYCQGFHLAIFGTPLFEEKIIAWQYGPVVPETYHNYKDNGSGVITPPSDFDTSVFSEDEFGLIKEVYDVYGQFSALKLMNMTHEEAPWKETAISDEITHEKLVNYFKRLVNTDGEK